MKERIKLLAEQATTYIEPTSNSGEGWIFDKEKFAGLLIQECMDICERLGDQGMDGHYCVDEIYRRFK
jgi:hypothetical protein